MQPNDDKDALIFSVTCASLPRDKASCLGKKAYGKALGSKATAKHSYMREGQEILLVSIDLLGPIHVMVEEKLKHSLRKCKSLREILSLLLCEVRTHPDFGQPDSVEELQRYFLLLVNNSPVEASMIDAQLGSEDRVTIVSLSHGG